MHNLLNKHKNMITFTSKIDYYIASEFYFNQMQNNTYQHNIGATLAAIFNSQTHLIHYDAKTLDQRLQILNGSPLKGIWDQFYNSVKTSKDHALILANYKKLKKEFPPNEELGIFKYTDLCILKDNELSVFSNWIRPSELPKLIKEYNDFINKIRWVTNEDPNFSNIDTSLFQSRVYLDILTLMSRPQGRELIRKIMSKSDLLKPIEIKISNIFSYAPFDNEDTGHQLGYAIYSYDLLQELPNHGLDIFTSPSFICFAHELIHMLHVLEKSYKCHNKAIPLPNGYDSWEEHYTIEGTCPCHGTAAISEKTLREQFDLPPRKTHWGNLTKATCSDSLFEKIVTLDSKPLLIRIFRDHPDPYKAMNHLFNTQNFRAISQLIEAAERDKSLRKGLLAFVKYSSESSSNFNGTITGATQPISTLYPVNPLLIHYYPPYPFQFLCTGTMQQSSTTSSSSSSSSSASPFVINFPRYPFEWLCPGGAQQPTNTSPSVTELLNKLHTK
jgi:hypothetical protein